MSRVLTLWILTGLLLSGQKPMSAAESCASLFSPARSSASLFRSRIDGTLFEVIRANAPHFWAWSREKARDYFSPEQLVEGPVVGDPHILNFGYAFIEGKYRFTLLDIDDSGFGPIVLDLTHFMVGLKAMNPDIKTKNILAAYKEGLGGKSPRVTTDEMKEIRDQYAGKPEFDLEEFESLTPFSEVPTKFKSLYKNIESQLLASRAITEVVEVRYRMKEKGGSRDMPRFIIKGVVGGEPRVYEFKLLDVSAPHYWKNDSPVDRVQTIESAGYRPKVDDEYIIVKTEAGDFLSRPRYDFSNVVRKLLENNPEGKEIRIFALFMAQYMGYVQSLHKAGPVLLDLIQRDEITFKEQIKAFVKDYTRDLERLVETM